MERAGPGSSVPPESEGPRGGEKAAEKPSNTQKIRIEQHSFGGMLWFGGWLFTIGFLQLPFWRAVLAILLWPYYLGAQFSPLP